MRQVFKVDAETKVGNHIARDFHLQSEHDEEALKEFLKCWLIEGFYSVTLSKVFIPDENEKVLVEGET